MIGWKLLKSEADLRQIEEDGCFTAETKPTEYPCWVFEHALYDETTAIEIIYRNDLERMLASL